MDTNLSRPLLSAEGGNDGERRHTISTAPSRLSTNSENTVKIELGHRQLSTSFKANLRRQRIRRFHDSELLMVETEREDTERLFSVNAARLAKKTVGVGIKSLFGNTVLRQEWIEQEDGTFINSSHHEHRKVKWMDILFDLALVGFQLHVWKLITQHFAEGKFKDGFVIAIVGYSFLVAIWKHVTLERNLYHGGSWRDTVLILLYLTGLIVAINGMHSCVQMHTCIDMLSDHAHGQCTLFGGGALGCCLLASSTSFLHSMFGPSKKMARPHAIEALLFLFAALPWFFVVAQATNIWETYFGAFLCICAILPIAAPPIIYGFCCPTWLRHSFQPVNIGYFVERVGLCFIVNLAVLIESSISDLCDDLHPHTNFCNDHHRRLSTNNEHKHGELQGHNHTLKDPTEGSDAFTMFILRIQGILMATMAKCMFFNVYRPSQTEENISQSRYSFFVDVNVILITILAIGLSLWSSENHLIICKYDYHRENGTYAEYSMDILEVTGTVCLYIAFSLWHVLHTRNGFRREGKGVNWTTRRFLSVCAIRIAFMALSIVLQKATEEYDVFVFIACFLLSLLVEEKLFDAPMFYGRKMDVRLALEEEENEKHTEMNR